MEENTVETTPTDQATVEPVTEEKSGLDLLLDEFASLKTRVDTLETIAHSGHTIDAPVIDTIATNVFARFNERLRNAFGRSSKPPQT